MEETSYITLPGYHAARVFFAKKEFLRSKVDKKCYFSFHSVIHHNLTCWQPETRKYTHIKVGVSACEKLDKHYSQLWEIAQRPFIWMQILPITTVSRADKRSDHWSNLNTSFYILLVLFGRICCLSLYNKRITILLKLHFKSYKETNCILNDH